MCRFCSRHSGIRPTAATDPSDPRRPHHVADPRELEIHEQARLGVLMTPMRVETRHLDRNRWRVDGNGHQSPGLEMIGHFKNGFHRDPLPSQRPTSQNIAIVALEPPGHRKPFGSFGCLQQSLELGCSGESQVQTFVPVRDQVRPGPRHAPARNIVWRSTQDAPAIRDFADSQCAVFGLTDEERQIQTFDRNINRPVRQTQPHGDLGVVGKKFRHLRGQQP